MRVDVLEGDLSRERVKEEVSSLDEPNGRNCRAVRVFPTVYLEVFSSLELWSIEYCESVFIKIFFLKKSDPMDMDKAV